MSIYVRVRKDFDGFRLDAEFEGDNEVLALLGASGCGKSMTLKCIAGVVRPDEGQIVVDGVTLFDSARKINLTPQQRRLGLLFQNYALFPNMTVEQNIMSVPAFRRKSDAGERLRALTAKFYIDGLENRYPSELSGGQQQRVALARIMASEPRVIMLDEPLAALDSYLRWQLENEIMQTLEEFGGTTLYVSHNRDEVYRLCDRVCVMNGGRTEPIRTVRALFESPDTLAASLLSGCKNYSRAQRRDAHTVHAEDWHVDLRCASAIGDEIRYIGVRAHYFKLCGAEDENAFDCRVLRVTEDVFSSVVSLMPVQAVSHANASRVRMELSKEQANSIHQGDVVSVKVQPSDILLLRK